MALWVGVGHPILHGLLLQENPCNVYKSDELLSDGLDFPVPVEVSTDRETSSFSSKRCTGRNSPRPISRRLTETPLVHSWQFGFRDVPRRDILTTLCYLASLAGEVFYFLYTENLSV